MSPEEQYVDDLDGADRYSNIVDRLDSIAEELADKAMSDLAQSISENGNTYSDEQKRLGKARRAVEKAAHLLRGEQSAW